jgi:hypothetical protein
MNNVAANDAEEISEPEDGANAHEDKDKRKKKGNDPNQAQV